MLFFGYDFIFFLIFCFAYFYFPAVIHFVSLVLSSSALSPSPSSFFFSFFIFFFHFLLAAHGGCELDGCQIFGNAYAAPSGSPNQAFTQEEQRELLAHVPATTNVLVTHCGGNRDVRKVLQRVQPRVHISGHYHEGHGARFVDWPDTGRTTVCINASILDARYHPVHLPVVFDYHL